MKQKYLITACAFLSMMIVRTTLWGQCDTVRTFFLVSLCPGELYEGMAWFDDTTLINTGLAANGCDSISTAFIEVLTPLPFEIEGPDVFCEGDTVQLGVSGTYTDYLWSSGENVQAIEVVAGGSYAVTVTNSFGCQAADTFLLETISLQYNLSLQPPGCGGASDGALQIQQLSGGSEPYVTSLNGAPFIGITHYTGLEAGDYVLQVQDASGCLATDTVEIAESSSFEVELTTDTIVRIGSGETLQIGIAFTSDSIVSYSWSTEMGLLSCLDCPDTELLQAVNTRIRLLAVSVEGCSIEIELQVIVDDRVLLYVPNAFSPNADQVNDALEVFAGNGIEGINTFEVFSRWGELVSRKTNLTPPYSIAWDGSWNGKAAVPGTYVWQAEIRLKEGTLTRRQGTCSLIR